MLCIALCMSVCLIQGIYLMTFYKQGRAYVTTNKNQIHFIEKRIQQLDERSKDVADAQKELETLTIQNSALLSAIPTFISGSKETIELLRYMHVNDFTHIRFKAIAEDDRSDLENNFISSRSYELTFVGRYKAIRDLIDHLNRSYQIIHIQSLELSNEVQAISSEQNSSLYQHFGEDFYKMVGATLRLTLYTRQSESDDEEIYQPDFSLRVNPEGAFALIQESELMEEEKLDVLVSQDSEQVLRKKEVKDLFTLNIGDILTSGDTYKFGGPGETNGGYVGLITDADVKIQLIIKENEYEMIIEDMNGKKDQVTVQIVLTHPEMHIISTMRAIYDTMPNISIFVENRTKQLMQISMEGDFTKNIKLFNEAGYLLNKGETRGFIKLI